MYSSDNLRNLQVQLEILLRLKETYEITGGSFSQDKSLRSSECLFNFLGETTVIFKSFHL